MVRKVGLPKIVGSPSHRRLKTGCKDSHRRVYTLVQFAQTKRSLKMVVPLTSILFTFLFVFINAKPQVGGFASLLSSSECEVVEKGSGDQKACKFPFISQGETFYGCTTKSDPDGLPWCSTEVNPLTQEHVTNQGKWGHCSDKCPTNETGAEAQNLIETLEQGI